MCDYERLPLDTCAECGKHFFVPFRSDWVYKRARRVSVDAAEEQLYFCSWHCLRAYDKKMEERRKRGRKKAAG